MTEVKHFEVVVIGGGPGGYVAAIKASQTSKSVCLIEKGNLGGTCLNVGCIPTKTLLANAEVMHKIKAAEAFGITTGPVSFDFSKMRQRKDAVVEKLRKGVDLLLQSNEITWFSGNAEFQSPKEIKVKGKDNLLIHGEKFIIATGSEPLDIPAFPCDHQRIFNSTSILDLDALPSSIAIIGGGYIGCEFASLYAEFGVKVTIVEALPSIISIQGKILSDALTRAFTRKGITIQTGAMVEGIDHHEQGVRIRLKDKAPLDCDIALVSIGRKIVTGGVGLEKAGVKTNDKGAILVNDRMETNVPGIYAIGDATGLFMLAHVASHQGIVAASNAVGKTAHMHYNAVPAVIFTTPEIATVGMTEEQAVQAGYSVITGKFPFAALGKSIATIETDGFAQVVAEKTTGQILGAQVLGHDASSLIAEMALAIQNELTLDSVAETIHAHPTIPEAWHEAVLMTQKIPIHFPPHKAK